MDVCWIAKKEPGKVTPASIRKEMGKPRMAIETSETQRRRTNVR
jgi:hypothetical protein